MCRIDEVLKYWDIASGISVSDQEAYVYLGAPTQVEYQLCDEGEMRILKSLMEGEAKNVFSVVSCKQELQKECDKLLSYYGRLTQRRIIVLSFCKEEFESMFLRLQRLMICGQGDVVVIRDA